MTLSPIFLLNLATITYIASLSYLFSLQTSFLLLFLFTSLFLITFFLYMPKEGVLIVSRSYASTFHTSSTTSALSSHLVSSQSTHT